MSVRVQDYKGEEIKVGTRVMYGEESPAEVIEIEDPDIDDSDELHVRYGLYVVIRFDDPVYQTDKLWCPIANEHEARTAHTYGPPMTDVLEIFEEPGDLEVII